MQNDDRKEQHREQFEVFLQQHGEKEDSTTNIVTREKYNKILMHLNGQEPKPTDQNFKQYIKRNNFQLVVDENTQLQSVQRLNKG